MPTELPTELPPSFDPATAYNTPVHPKVANSETSNSLVHTTELVDANEGVFTFELFEHDLNDPAGAITMFCRHINRCTRMRGHTHAHTHTCPCSAHSHICHHACT